MVLEADRRNDSWCSSTHVRVRLPLPTQEARRSQQAPLLTWYAYQERSAVALFAFPLVVDVLVVAAAFTFALHGYPPSLNGVSKTPRALTHPPQKYV